MCMAETVREYFGHITDVVKTFWEGLSVTLSYMLRRPITVQYPDRTEKRVADMLPSRYRGLLEVDMNVCTGCMACERACPDHASSRSRPTRIRRIPSSGSSPSSTSTSRSACSAACASSLARPAPSQHTREFESTMKSIDSLVFRWVPDPEKPAPFYRPVKGQDAPRAPVGRDPAQEDGRKASWIAGPSILVPDGAEKGLGHANRARHLRVSRPGHPDRRGGGGPVAQHLLERHGPALVLSSAWAGSTCCCPRTSWPSPSSSSTSAACWCSSSSRSCSPAKSRTSTSRIAAWAWSAGTWSSSSRPRCSVRRHLGAVEAHRRDARGRHHGGHRQRAARHVALALRNRVGRAGRDLGRRHRHRPQGSQTRLG